MFHIGIDPSLSQTGIAVFDEAGKVRYDKVKFEDTIGTGIACTYRRSSDMSRFVVEKIRQMGVEPTEPKAQFKFIIETPPPYSQYAAGLYMNFGFLLKELKMVYGVHSPLEVHGASSMAIKSLLGSIKAKKKDSVVKACKFLDVFGFTYGRVNADQADAINVLFIYLLKNEVLFNAQTSDESERSKRISIFRVI